MDFTSAVRTINSLLTRLRPVAFGSSWIRIHAPKVYRFMLKAVRTEAGGIDWDRLTRALDRKLQRKWQADRRGRRPAGIKGHKIVEKILDKYRDKLYAFLAPADKHDRRLCDVISIELVRLAQCGNMAARNEVVKLLWLSIESWIERYPWMARWAGRADMVDTHIQGCIRRYRYSGSFIGYLFKTLNYAARGLRPLVAYSLDDFLYEGDTRRGDLVGYDGETNEILVYR